MAPPLELHINGTRRSLDVDPGKSLLAVLRENLDLIGSKYGCGEGQCGACMVLVDNRPVRACITPVGTVAARPITTIEGVAAQNGKLHAVQQAFLQETALQCGYCTSGMIMSAVGLLNRNPNPTRDDIVRGLDANICRCGAYTRIIAAVQRAAGAVRAEASNNG